MAYEKIKTFYNKIEGYVWIDKNSKFEPNKYYHNCAYGNNFVAILSEEEYNSMVTDYSGLSDRVRMCMSQVVAADKELGLPLPEKP